MVQAYRQTHSAGISEHFLRINLHARTHKHPLGSLDAHLENVTSTLHTNFKTQIIPRTQETNRKIILTNLDKKKSTTKKLTCKNKFH